MAYHKTENGHMSLPEKNSGEAGNTSLEATIGAAGEAAIADIMIQQPNQTGEAAGTSITQDSAESSSIQPTHEEVLREIASIEGFGNSTLENVAQLAELCAKGAPSEKDFQRIKGLISQSSAQERKV
jgi:hypothetical protein